MLCCCSNLYFFLYSLYFFLTSFSLIFGLLISIPKNLETIFQNKKINPYFNTTFFLPSCSSQNTFSNNKGTFILIDLLPTDTLPKFTMYINEPNSQSYFNLLQIAPYQYQLTINNLCSSEPPEQGLSFQSVNQLKELKESTNNLKIVKFSFIYRAEEYYFYIANICSEQKKLHSIMTFILMLIIYCIIMYLVTMFHIDFQIANFIHTHFRLKWWVGPIIVGTLSVGILLLYHIHFFFWISNFLLVGLSGLTCTQTLNWLMTEIANLEIQNEFLEKVQKCLLKELFCKQNLISLICSLFFKIIFIIWIATQSVVLGNLMVFCFIFVVVSSVRVTKFKNCFWLLLWIIIYEILWKYFSQQYFNVNLNLLMSQTLTAPQAVQIKNYQCWQYIYISEFLFPGIALKFCKIFDKTISEQGKRSYYTCGFLLIVLAKMICFIWEMEFYYLLIVTITLIIGLTLKCLKDGVFPLFWKGEERINIFGEHNEEGDDSDEEAPNAAMDMMISKTELKHFL